MANEFGISLDDAKNEIASLVKDAIDFMQTEFSADWERAEKYFAGESDLPITVGRSSIVKTEVRDAIRAILPSVMRVLMHSRKPVEYIPERVQHAAFVEQQSLWVRQQFMKSGGYMQLLSAVNEALRVKSGPIKVFWEENPNPEHIIATGLTATDVMEYKEAPDLVVTEVTDHKYDAKSPFEGTLDLYDLKAVKYYSNGKLCMEAFPIYEFFVNRNASTIANALVHGHTRTITVGEAMELGLEYDDWESIDNDNPEDDSGAAKKRRGYQVEAETASDDILRREILLTEAYAEFDLDGDGVAEKYCFYLGGSTYTYLHHEPVEDWCIDVASVDPQPFTVIGRSVADLAYSSQDTSTSLLRAMLDNAHIANNPRPAGDPQRINFEDLMNNAIGAPIKTKGDAKIQLFDVPFTAGNLLPVLDWLEADGEQRIGITKAATGLDPNAMQSTDKQAVLNTIQLSQGQVELMVRNVIETALIPIFKKMLRLSIRHMDQTQMLMYKGAVIPVDISMFDSDLIAEPTVGIGTASPEQKLQTLNFVYGEQQKYMQQYGLDNPFTSLSQMYNCLEDMIELGGIVNVGRYFSYVGKKEEEIVAQKMAEQAQQAAIEAQKNQPIDPSKALMAIESGRSRVKLLEAMAKQRSDDSRILADVLKEAEALDYKRDKMDQDRFIALVKENALYLNKTIESKQNASTPSDKSVVTQPAVSLDSVPEVDVTLEKDNDRQEPSIEAEQPADDAGFTGFKP